MIKVTGYEKKTQYTQIHWEQNVLPNTIGPLIMDGILEQYMGSYGTTAEETLSYLLADILYNDIDVPPMDDPDAEAKISALLSRIKGRIKWIVDKSQLLADMTLEDDLAEEMKASWANARAEMLKTEAPTKAQSERKHAEARKAYVAGVERREEEILADDIMANLPPENRRAPRGDRKTKQAPEKVGLAIEIVP